MRIHQIAIAVDQLANAILGGYADECMSARCWRLRDIKPYCYLQPVIDGLFFWQPDHCKGSFEAAFARAYSPKEYQ